MKTYFLINCLELIRGAGSRVYLSVVIMTSNLSENAFGININFWFYVAGNYHLVKRKSNSKKIKAKSFVLSLMWAVQSTLSSTEIMFKAAFLVYPLIGSICLELLIQPNRLIAQADL